MTPLAWMNVFSSVACLVIAGLNVALTRRLRRATRAAVDAETRMKAVYEDFTRRLTSGRLLVTNDVDGATGRLAVHPDGDGDLRISVEYDAPTTRTVQ